MQHRTASRVPILIAVAALLGVVIRWSLRAWITPYVDGSLWIYGAQILFEWARTCGLGIMAAMALMFMGGRLRRQVGCVERRFPRPPK